MSAPVTITVRPGVTLAPDAAASFTRAEKAWGKRIDVNRSYADYNTQMRLYLAYQRDPKNNPLALHPDKSMHCKGLAIDSDDHTKKRFNGLMAEHGWIRTALAAGEPWHYDYSARRDTHYGEPAGGDERPFPTPTQEDEMAKWVKSTTTQYRYDIGEFTVDVYKTQEEAQIVTDAYGRSAVPMSSDDVKVLLNRTKARAAAFSAQLAAKVDAVIADES